LSTLSLHDALPIYQHDLVWSHLGSIHNRHDGAARNLQKAHLFRDFHVSHHGTTVESDLSASIHGCIDSSLHAVDIRCERRDDDALTSTRYQPVKGCWDIAFRC